MTTRKEKNTEIRNQMNFHNVKNVDQALSFVLDSAYIIDAIENEISFSVPTMIHAKSRPTKYNTKKTDVVITVELSSGSQVSQNFELDGSYFETLKSVSLLNTENE